MYEAHAEKQKVRYEESLRGYEINERAKALEEGKAVQPKTEAEEAARPRYNVEAQDERVVRDARGDEDVEMGNTGGPGVGGFTSING